MYTKVEITDNLDALRVLHEHKMNVEDIARAYNRCNAMSMDPPIFEADKNKSPYVIHCDGEEFQIAEFLWSPELWRFMNASPMPTIAALSIVGMEDRHNFDFWAEFFYHWLRLTDDWDN